MDRERFSDMACSVARAAGVVADPWALLVLRDLFLGLNRYEELRRDLGVATNVLADRLQRLVATGLITRHAYQQAPVRHEYRLTEAGGDLYDVVLAMLAWGDKHLTQDAPPMRLRHATCGHDTVPIVACDQCGGELSADNLDVLPGPGGRFAPGTAVIAERLAHGQGRSPWRAQRSTARVATSAPPIARPMSISLPGNRDHLAFDATAGAVWGRVLIRRRRRPRVLAAAGLP